MRQRAGRHPLRGACPLADGRAKLGRQHVRRQGRGLRHRARPAQVHWSVQLPPSVPRHGQPQAGLSYQTRKRAAGISAHGGQPEAGMEHACAADRARPHLMAAYRAWPARKYCQLPQMPILGELISAAVSAGGLLQAGLPDRCCMQSSRCTQKGSRPNVPIATAKPQWTTIFGCWCEHGKVSDVSVLGNVSVKALYVRKGPCNVLAPADGVPS